MHKETLRRYRP
jgi:GMP synthase-like glutamine amidotransferase